MQTIPGNNESVLRLKAAMGMTGLARSTIYARMKVGTFPKPIRLGPRAVGWLLSEIQNWLVEQVATSRPTISMSTPSSGTPVHTGATA